MAKKINTKAVFIGPSIGTSIICTIPLLIIKMCSLVDLSWFFVTCPLWIGFAICFLLWLWFSTLNIICKAIKPVFVPIIVFSDSSENEEK